MLGDDTEEDLAKIAGKVKEAAKQDLGAPEGAPLLTEGVEVTEDGDRKTEPPTAG